MTDSKSNSQAETRISKTLGHFLNLFFTGQSTPPKVRTPEHDAYIKSRNFLFSCMSEDNSDLPKLNITKCIDTAQMNVTRMLASPEAAAIRTMFHNAGLVGEIGFNQGLGQLKYTFNFPSREMIFAPCENPSQAILWAGLGFHHHQAAYEHDYKSAVQADTFATSYPYDEVCPESAQRSVDLTRDFFLQTAISDIKEDIYRDNIYNLVFHTSTPDYTNTSYKDKTSTNLLSNRCLHIFSYKTHCIITHVKIDYNLLQATLTLEPWKYGYMRITHPLSGAENTLNFLTQTEPVVPHNNNVVYNPFQTFSSAHLVSDSNVKGYRYNAMYCYINGYDIYQGGSWSVQIKQKQVEVITSILLDIFWNYVKNTLRYYPNDDLVSYVNGSLHTHFTHVLSTSPTESFNLYEFFQLYTWGTAGIGKTTFIRVFISAITFIIHQCFEPRKSIGLVRVPMNQMTPNTLHALLMVKGISDWSIERILEQTICKGGLCVLHLEEQPEDQALQEELTSMLVRMSKVLLARYPEYRNNIILVHTANYEPCTYIRDSGPIVYVQPLSKDLQRTWALLTLQDTISRQVIQLTSASTYSPYILTYPHPAPHFKTLPSQPVSQSLVNCTTNTMYVRYFIEFTNLTSGEDVVPYTKDLRKLETWKSCVGYSIITYLSQHAGKLNIPYTANSMYILPITCRITASKVGASTHLLHIHFPSLPALSSVPPLVLSSKDLFFYSPSTTKLYTLPTVSKYTSLHHIWKESTFIQLQIVLNMWKQAYLKPSVIVLAGEAHKCRLASVYIRDMIHTYYARYMDPNTLPSTEHRLSIKYPLFPANNNITLAEMKTMYNVPVDKGDEDNLVEPILAPQVFFNIPNNNNNNTNTSNTNNNTHLITPVNMSNMTSTSTSTNTQCSCGGCPVSMNDVSKPILREFYAFAKTKRHQQIMLGDPDPSTGVLLKFLNHISKSNQGLVTTKELQDENIEHLGYTDETLCPELHGKDYLGVVYAQCNDSGQFFLRDLVDAGDSLTHVTTVAKDRVLFVIVIETPAKLDTEDIYKYIQPQLISRGHAIVICK